jgi:glutamate N-acetyltransferase/amino-acid N-acetyltransferase
LTFLQNQSHLPSGFSVGTSSFSFTPQELPTLAANMTLTMLSLDNPEGTASWAGMFTKNAFPGSPVVVGRSLLAQSDSRLRGVIINNKISNVFPGGDSSGVDNARQVAEAAQTALEAVKDTTTTHTNNPTHTPNRGG